VSQRGGWISRVSTVGAAVLAATVGGCANHERTVPVSTPGEVPPVIGNSLATAVIALEEAGLRPDPRLGTVDGAVADPADCPGAPVAAQDPDPHITLVRGSPVVVVVDSCPTGSPSPSP
jgi:beta-lactam-binding protein with PASTA domain